MGFLFHSPSLFLCVCVYTTAVYIVVLLNICTGLQGELEAAYKELNCVKNKIRLQETELDNLRSRHSDKEDDYNLRYSRCLVLHTLLITSLIVFVDFLIAYRQFGSRSFGVETKVRPNAIAGNITTGAIKFGPK